MCIASSSNQEEDSRPQKLLKYIFSFHKLKKLSFSKVGLEIAPEEFLGISSLESLPIKECEKLKEIPEWIDNFTSLKELHLYGCPKLTSLPKQICSLCNLERLETRDCLDLKEIKQGLAVPRCINTLTSLKELVIDGCPELTSLPKQIANLSNSETLKINRCLILLYQTQQREPRDKGKEVLIPPFLTLKELVLENVGIDNASEEFQGLSSLESLTIIECAKLKEIPKWVDNLISLKKLSLELSRIDVIVRGSDQMDNLSSLESLGILYFGSLKQICQQLTHQDWHFTLSFPSLKQLTFGYGVNGSSSEISEPSLTGITANYDLYTTQGTRVDLKPCLP
ncbi:hypothetical protein Cgig2_007953 [Carnegiea gigantea]|uniref:Disease resistance R13L4/SHOC-2-like LRR domain-containing protein n=1 Tax=Carnegiea gigantea TaxID=171969 RepID=A0A9Q1KEP0_9CARY|nr:hypothetical protein Cgig2_007953 [Carnegiea gigantea]